MQLKKYTYKYLSKEVLEVKLPTLLTDEKAEVGRAREEKRRERVRRKSQKKESEERVRRTSQKKESEERVGRKSQKKESEEKVRRKSQKKEDAGAQKGRKVATHCVFQMICGFVGSKSRLAKAAGAEPPGLMRN